MNLEVESVSFSPASVAPGEWLTVSYKVKNAGDAAAKGSIRDVVRIKSAANGGTIVAGTVTQNYNLEPDATATFTARVTMPAAPAGDWFVGIDVNPNRDVFEQNMQKNYMWTADAVEVTLQEMSCGDGVHAVTAPAGTTVGYVLAGVPSEGGVVVITGGSQAIAGLTARVATGHMPTATICDAVSFVRADGALVVVVPATAAAGDGRPPVYLAIENTGITTAAVSVKVEKLSRQLWSVWPLSAANKGDMGFTLTGSGLDAEIAYYLGDVRAKSVTVLDSANVYAVFDLRGLAAGRYYDVRTGGSSSSATVIRDAVRIDKAAVGPVVEAKLELPERTRDNRVYTGYVVYENKGDTQVNVPMFTVRRGKNDKTTLLGAAAAGATTQNDGLSTNELLIAGIGASNPSGVLKPGESGRLPFRFKPVGDYDLTLGKWIATRDDVAEMATRLNLRGRADWDGNDIYYSALNVRNGNAVAGVSGWCLDARTREPLAETELYIVPTNNTTRVAGSATTDADGYFQFPLLNDGAYAFIAADNSRVVSTGVVAVVKGQTDVNGVEVLALPPARVHGYVIGSDGTPIQYGNVALRLEEMFSGATVETDGFGAYTFTGVMDGEYEVHALAFECYEEALSDKFTISETNLDVRADIVMRSLACVHGTVSYEGVPVTNGVVEVMTSEAEMKAVSIDTNGTWRVDGIAPGRCTFTLSARGYALMEAATLDVQPGDGNRLDLEAIDGPLFGVGHRVAYVEEGVPFNERLYVLNPSTNDVSYTWNFGDGSPEVTTTSVHTYHEYVRTAGTNSFDVTLTIRMADGTTDYRTLLEVVNLLPPVETIYRENAIILSEERRVNAGTLEFIGFDPDGAEEGTVMVLKGEADIPLDGAAVMVGYVTNKGVVSDIRRVISHETRPDGTVWCTTGGDVGFLDIFEQIAETISQDVVIPAEKPEDERLSANNKVGSALAKFLKGTGHAVAEGAKKTGAHFMNGGKLIGELATSLGCEMGPNCLTGHIDTEISTVVRRYVCEEGYWTNYGHKTQRWHPAYDNTYTNTVYAYTIVTHLDFKPYLQIEGSSGIGFEKRTDKCELWTPEKGWSIKIHGVPIDDIKPTLQFRPYLSVGASGGLKLFLRVWGDLIFNLELENTIHEKPVRISCDYDGIKTESGVEQLEERDFIGSVEGGVGVLFGMKGRVAKVIDVLTGIELAAQLKVWRGQTKAEPVSAEARIAANYVLEATLKDFNVFSRIMDRISFIKFSGAIANLVNWRWRAAKSDFDWEQETGSKEKGYVVKFEDWSIPSYKAHMSGGWGEGLSRALNLWSWWKGFKWEVSRKRWIIDEDPIDSVGWCFGDTTYNYTNNMEYAKTRYYDFGKPGKYNVWMKIYSGPLWFFGYCCNKTVEVKEMEEEEEKEEEPVDESGASTQKSVDPNEMAGPGGYGENRIVKPGDWMEYTVYFENKKDAGIAAQEVFVDNALSGFLDWSTFEMRSVSVAGQIDNGLDGATAAEIAAAAGAGDPLASEMAQTNGLYKTRTEVSFDETTGLASWYIRIVDPSKTDGENWPDDPDAGVLQPNVNAPEGEGYICYRVKVRDDAPGGSVIDNSATIVFDRNPPIETDPAWWNTVATVYEQEIDLGDGETTKLTLVVGMPFGDIPAPKAREGYTFGGWFTGPNGTGRKITRNTVVEEGDSAVYANWIADWFDVEFVEPEVVAVEGSNAVIRIIGGSKRAASSVKVNLFYETAAAADVNLAKATVASEGGAATATGLKFPITVKWAKGELGEKTVTIPLKTDTLYEGDETFSLLLSGETGANLGANFVCVVAIADANEPTTPSGAVMFDGGYYTVKKGNATAKALPGYVFVAWVYESNGKTYSTKATITDKLRKSKKVKPKFAKAAYLRALVAEPGTGTVKGQGKYSVGKTVTLKATPKKGYVFTGWRVVDTANAAAGGSQSSATADTANSKVVSLETSYKYKVGETGGTVVASFTKESALPRPVVALADATGETFSQAASGNARTISVGVAYPATVAVASEAKISIKKVAGLPKGLTWKNGKITGVPSKAGKSTLTLTVALAANAKKKWTCKIPFTVVDLPEWARGKFTGTVNGAKATMTVGATGKISGKFALGGTNWTFSATSYAKDSVVTGAVLRFAGDMSAKGVAGSKTATAPFSFALVADPEKSEIASFTESGSFGDGGDVFFSRDAGVKVAKAGATGGGTVTLSPALGQGATVKVTAKAKKGYTFTGWRVAGTSEVLSTALSYTVSTAGGDVSLTATFKKESAIAKPVLDWADTALTVGVAYAAKPAVNCEAAVKVVKVAGLPKGLTWKSGKMSGVPSKAGKSTVSFTVALATNAKKTWTLKKTLTVEALPAYAKGTYKGTVAPNAEEDADLGAASITVGATGKISGKFTEYGTNWTFSASSYTSRIPGASPGDSDVFVCSNVVATYFWIVKNGGKSVSKSRTRNFTLAVSQETLDGSKLGCARATESGGALVETWQNVSGGRAGSSDSKWYAGDFSGYGEAQFPSGDTVERLGGVFALTVAQDMKFTGSFAARDGKKSAISGKFAKTDEFGVTAYVAKNVAVTVNGTKVVMPTVYLTPVPYAGKDYGFGQVWGGTGGDASKPVVVMPSCWQNVWLRGDLSGKWKPSFASGAKKTVKLAANAVPGAKAGDTLTYAFGGKGSVTVTGKLGGKSVSTTAKIGWNTKDDGEATALDGNSVVFIANGRVWKQSFKLAAKSTIAAADITLAASGLEPLD